MKIPFIFPTGILIWSHFVTIQLSTVTKCNIVACCYVLLWKPWVCMDINFVLLIKKKKVFNLQCCGKELYPQSSAEQRSLWLVEVTVIMEMFKLQRAQNRRKWERWMQLGAPLSVTRVLNTLLLTQHKKYIHIYKTIIIIRRSSSSSIQYFRWKQLHSWRLEVSPFGSWYLVCILAWLVHSLPNVLKLHSLFTFFYLFIYFLSKSNLLMVIFT